MVAETRKWHICMTCIICNELVEMNELEQMKLDFGQSICPKVCEKCRLAVLRMRKETEKDGKV